ncbi:hypothetical protein ACP4OV_012354 [Aristida adscensionis]
MGAASGRPLSSAVSASTGEVGLIQKQLETRPPPAPYTAGHRLRRRRPSPVPPAPPPVACESGTACAAGRGRRLRLQRPPAPPAAVALNALALGSPCPSLPAGPRVARPAAVARSPSMLPSAAGVAAVPSAGGDPKDIFLFPSLARYLLRGTDYSI